MSKFNDYVELTRLNKPIGIFLLLWPTLSALWIAAKGFPDPLVLVVFVGGVVLMRSAGCVINDYADRDIDPHVERTRLRPIAAGRVKPSEALILFSLLSLCAFGLVLLMNSLTIWMSLAALFFAATYPFMKRYTHLPQVYLGIAFAWAVPMSFAAQTGEVPKVAWLLFLATVLWTTAYDTMYGMVDRDDDIKIGVKSTAILFGPYDRFVIALLQLLVVVSLLMIGSLEMLGGYYYVGVGGGACLFAYQQFLIRNREKQTCFRAFLNNNWFGLVLFSGFVLDYYFF